MRVGVLASGSGTILEALLGRKLPIVVVVADRTCGALGIARARQQNLEGYTERRKERDSARDGEHGGSENKQHGSGQ